jgi:hypothetical protein
VSSRLVCGPVAKAAVADHLGLEWVQLKMRLDPKCGVHGRPFLDQTSH